MSFRSVVFHPAFVLVASIASAVAYAAFVRWRIPDGSLFHHYLYVVPIVVPFTAFVFDRAKEARAAGLAVLMIDALVVATSILRARGFVPFVSGHALFLTYAIIRPGSLVTRITAAMVMLEVIYLKIFLWHDLITPVGGVLVALIAFMIVHLLRRSRSNQSQAATENLT
jgi:hypothetical protein